MAMTTGAHRAETYRGPELAPVQHHRGHISRAAGQIMASAWRAQAAGTRTDLETDRALRVLDRRAREFDQ